MSNQLIEDIDAILDLFGPNGEHWIKGHWAIDELNCPIDDGVDVLHPDATCFCLQGAIGRVTHHNPNSGAYAPRYRILHREIENQIGIDYGEAYITDWNDDRDRIYADVVELLHRVRAWISGNMALYARLGGSQTSATALDDDQAVADRGFE